MLGYIIEYGGIFQNLLSIRRLAYLHTGSCKEPCEIVVERDLAVLMKLGSFVAPSLLHTKLELYDILPVMLGPVLDLALLFPIQPGRYKHTIRTNDEADKHLGAQG